MMTRPLRSLLTTVVLLVLIPTIPAHAGTILSMVSTGDGLFSIHGIGVAGVVSMDIMVTYDPSAIANPQVVQGRLIAGAVMRANTRDPGVVQIAVFREPPINGTGAIVTLNFERIGEPQGAVTSVSARLTDMRGAVIPAQVQLLNSSDNPTASGLPQSEPSSTVSGGPAASDPAAPPAPFVPPVVPPGTDMVTAETGMSVRDAPPRVPVEPVQPRPVPAPMRSAMTGRKGAEPAADATTRVKKVVVMQKSVLERFEEYRGARTPQALIGLFDQDALLGCRQEPSLVLTDGSSKAKVTIIAPSDLRGTPDVAVINASLVSIERDRESTNTWIATVQPHRASTDARMLISLPDKTLIIPLTVAPKVPLPSGTAGVMTEKDFEAYLRGDGGKGSPARDLNSDGIINYLDYYIFTANYIANQQRPGDTSLPGN